MPKREVAAVRTQSALSSALGLSTPTISRYVGEGLPRLPDGSFDVAACRSWIAQQQAISGRGGGGGKITRGLDAWRERKTRAEALRAEQSLALDKGDLVTRAHMDRTLLAVVDSFVSALEALPPKVVPLLHSATSMQEQDSILRNYIRSVRVQLVAMHSPAPEPVPADPTDDTLPAAPAVDDEEDE